MERTVMEGPTHPQSILLVEEDLDVRSIIREVLEFEGYSVVVATDVTEAMQWVSRPEGLGLILLRWTRWINQETGGFIQDVRRNPALARVPIILLMGEHRPPLPGAQAILHKPFTLEQLLELVSAFHR